jgi:hypothetical protein
MTGTLPIHITGLTTHTGAGIPNYYGYNYYGYNNYYPWYSGYGYPSYYYGNDDL